MTRAKQLLMFYQQQQQASSHTELSYLQSTGTQWIDTGIKGKSGLKVEISFERQMVTSAGCIIGSRVSSSSNLFTLNHDSATNLFSGYSNGNTTIPSFELETPYIIIKDDNKTYINGTLMSTVTAAVYNNNLNMYLFALNQAGLVTQQDKLKLYYCKIWDGVVLVCDFIPVLKDDTYCMYDKVSGIYFYNQGTGSFIGA